MKYYLGPWQWVTDESMPHYSPPSGAIRALDFGTLPEQSVGGASRPGCLCWTDGSPLGSEYDLIGEGDCREIKRSGKLVAALAKHRQGHTPDGDSLHSMIMDGFIGGSDPDGNSSCKPIMPGVDGWMDLWMPGHGRVKGERFEWGRSPHTIKVQRALQGEFAELMGDAEKGKLKDRQHHRRVLDFWCDKYGVSDWTEFVPQKLRKDVPGRLKHETTYTDDFNRADSSGMTGWSATLNSGFDIAANQARGANVATNGTRSRFDSDVSSVDHYVQEDVVSFGSQSGSNHGPLARHSSSADTCYAWLLRNTSAYRRLFKIVAGAATVLASDTTLPGTPTFTLKLSCNGSALKVYIDGVEVSGLATTDTAISSGLRGGMQGQMGNSGTQWTIHDNFEMADLAASGLLYTQLERATRGVNRGTYTSY